MTKRLKPRGKQPLNFKSKDISKSMSSEDPRHSSLVCFSQCKNQLPHKVKHKDLLHGILEALLSFSCAENHNRLKPHPIGNGEYSIDIKDPSKHSGRSKWRMTYQKEGGTNIIVKLCTDETHNK